MLNRSNLMAGVIFRGGFANFGRLFLSVLLIFCCVGPIFAQVFDLSQYEQCLGSQQGEVGVIKKLFDLLGTTNKYYVEFGASDGNECNTKFFRLHGWHGLMMDKDCENKRINLRKEFVTPENICVLLSKYEVPCSFDLLSIDIDYNDFYVLHELLKKYRPRVIVAEYNATHLPDEDKVVVYDPKGWDGSNYFGASIRAFYNLGIFHGYTLVYAENMGVNLFLVDNETLKKSNIVFKYAGDYHKLYKKPRYGRGPNGGHYADSLNRKYVNSNEILKN